MALFKFHFDNKILLIFMTSIVWAFVFRSTFKNINMHMGLGSYASLKFEPLLYLIKNIICIFYFIGFFIEIKNNRLQNTKQPEIFIEKKEGNMILVQQADEKTEDILKDLEKSQNLNGIGKKIWFGLKVFFMILFISIVDDAYFICSNNHIIDRVICPIRNLGMLLSLSLLSILFLQKTFFRNMHQLIPFIIIFIISFTIIFVNYKDIDRFKKKFGSTNMIVYLVTFFCMGIEMIFIKILTDVQYLSIYLILGIKGIIGTIIFAVAYPIISQEKLFEIFDTNFNFEYEFLNEEFPIFYKILYIVSMVILQLLIVYTVNQFSENHILSAIMFVDILYFPIYCLERFAIQGFPISTPSLFWPNMTVGIVNFFLMLIFNEILECNFWGLNRNLKINIEKRQKKDEFYKKIKGDNPGDDILSRDSNRDSNRDSTPNGEDNRDSSRVTNRESNIYSKQDSIQKSDTKNILVDEDDLSIEEKNNKCIELQEKSD